MHDKASFVMFHHDHHGDDRLAIWCAAPPGVQAELADQEPQRFFRPPDVGHRGWLGVRLDVELDWDEVASIVADADRVVAPKGLVRQLDGTCAAPGSTGETWEGGGHPGTRAGASRDR